MLSILNSLENLPLELQNIIYAYIPPHDYLTEIKTSSKKYNEDSIYITIKNNFLLHHERTVAGIPQILDEDDDGDIYQYYNYEVFSFGIFYCKTKLLHKYRPDLTVLQLIFKLRPKVVDDYNEYMVMRQVKPTTKLNVEFTDEGNIITKAKTAPKVGKRKRIKIK